MYEWMNSREAAVVEMRKAEHILIGDEKQPEDSYEWRHARRLLRPNSWSCNAWFLALSHVLQATITVINSCMIKQRR
eukprot:2170252-Pleurochrysis_carterae.AAC.1